MSTLTWYSRLVIASTVFSATAAIASPFPCGGTCYLVQTYAGNTTYSDEDGELDGVTQTSSYADSGADTHQYIVAQTSADLSQGAIRASVVADLAGGTSATMYEVFKFNLPDGVESVDIPVRWTIEGTVNFDTATNNGTGAYFSVGTFSNYSRVTFDDLFFEYNNPRYQELNSNGYHKLRFFGTLKATSNEKYSVQSSLYLGFKGSGSLDFGNTSYFNFLLPEGVSILSSSGVLLTDPIVAGVPEPSSWAMMVLGFSLAGFVTRKNLVDKFGVNRSI